MELNKYLINDYKDLPSLDKNCCVIGNFDGMHLAHQGLINEAKEEKIPVLVITFLNLIKNDKKLQNLEQKEEAIQKMGVDYLIVFNYDKIKDLFYYEFIKILKKLNVIKIVCGLDFRFGFHNEGDLIDLENKFKVKEFADFYLDNHKISSSYVKTLLIDGNIALANKLLSRPYTIEGKVIHGNAIGRKLGYKTANIEYNDYLLPKNGVYFTRTKINGKIYGSMTNVGNNPTINYQEKTRLETYILDFDEDIYDMTIEIEFYQYLRGEKKFASKEELIKSLGDLVLECKELNKKID